MKSIRDSREMYFRDPIMTHSMSPWVNIPVTLGDAGAAVDVARGIDLSAIAVTERKACLLINVARAFLQWAATIRHICPCAQPSSSRMGK
jgi:hypothetical protein